MRSQEKYRKNKIFEERKTYLPLHHLLRLFLNISVALVPISQYFNALLVVKIKQ